MVLEWKYRLCRNLWFWTALLHRFRLQGSHYPISLTLEASSASSSKGGGAEASSMIAHYYFQVTDQSVEIVRKPKCLHWKHSVAGYWFHTSPLYKTVSVTSTKWGVQKEKINNMQCSCVENLICIHFKTHSHISTHTGKSQIKCSQI